MLLFIASEQILSLPTRASNQIAILRPQGSIYIFKMGDHYEARSELLLPGWNDDIPPSTELRSTLHPDLCHNCNCIMQELGKYVGENGDESPFTSESKSVQLARFQDDQRLRTKDCRFCRVIQSCNPVRFVDGGVYPTLAYLSRKSEWGLSNVWTIEFAQSSTFPSPIGRLSMLPISGLYRIFPPIPNAKSKQIPRRKQKISPPGFQMEQRWSALKSG